MTCDEALRELLEADPSTLGPGSGTSLGRHLEACPRCREAARLVRRGTDELDRWLDASTPELDVDAVLARAGTSAGSGRPRRARLPAGLRFGLPVALAAAVAALILLDGPDGPLPGTPVHPGSGSSAEAGLDLDVPSGRNAAVLETNDPDITVVWFLQGD